MVEKTPSFGSMEGVEQKNLWVGPNCDIRNIFEFPINVKCWKDCPWSQESFRD